MPLIIPPGFAQCSWQWELNGDPEYINTTCGVYVTEYGGNFQAAANDCADAMGVAFPAAQMSDQFRFRGVVLRVGQDGAPPIIVEAPRDVVGLGGAAILPSNCALLVRKLTNAGGRRNKGRFYFPLLAILENAVSQIGVVSPLDLANMQGRLNVLHVELMAGSPNPSPVILHSSGGVTPPGIPTEVTGFSAQPIIATQRRRMRR
jgi:hypothetical protein